MLRDTVGEGTLSVYHVDREDIWTQILQFLKLPELLSVGETCRTMNEFVAGVTRRRLICIILPWTATHFESFLNACKSTSCVITGSCARAMFGAYIPYPTRNLNLVCAQQGLEVMHTFILSCLGFRQVSDTCHPALSDVVGQFHQYARGERVITLTTPKPGMHVLHIIVRAPSTADMVIMTGGGVACFYPKWFEEGVSVVTHARGRGFTATKLGCAGDILHPIVVHENTEFLRRPCGNECPTLWHHVQSTPLLLSLDWSSDNSVKTIFADADVEWRLNSLCMNTACPYNVSVKGANQEFAGSRSEADVAHVSAQIACRMPTFNHIFQGIFYGATCTQAHVVPVPVRDGVDGPATLDNLDVNYWVKQHSLDVYTTARRRLRRSFDRLPHSSGELDGLYTLFFERPAAATPKNQLVRKMVRQIGCTDVILGSVLVIKEAHGGLKDMTHDDIVRTNLLINSLLYYGCLPKATGR